MSAQQESVKNSDEIYKKISKFVPDIEWKVHQPLIEKINKLKKNGYIILENIISKKSTKNYKKKLDKVLKKRIKKKKIVGDHDNQIIYNYFYEDQSLLKLLYFPKVDKILNEVLDKNYILQSSKIDKKIKKGSSEYKKYIQNLRESLSIQRFKGLGEMNPEELWETTLNPDNRTMLRVQYTKGTKDKSKDDQKMIEILMGDEVAPRKDFITNNALDVANLDI